MGGAPRPNLTVTGRQRHAARRWARRQGPTRQLLTPQAAPGARGHHTLPSRRAPGNWQPGTSRQGAHKATLRHTPPPPATCTSQGKKESAPPELWPLTQAGAPVPRGPDDDEPSRTRRGTQPWWGPGPKPSSHPPQPPGGRRSREMDRRAGRKQTDCTTLARPAPPPPPSSPRRAGDPPGDAGHVPLREARGHLPPIPPEMTMAPEAGRQAGHAAGSTRRAPPDRHPPTPTVTLVSRSACQPASLPASHSPVHRKAPRRPPRAAPSRSARTVAGAVWRPHPPWAKRRQRGSLGARTREAEGRTEAERPPAPPPAETPRPNRTQPRPEGGRQAGRPPPSPPHPPDAGTPRTHRAINEGARYPEPGRGRRDRATPPRSTGPRQKTRRGTNRLEWPYERPAPEPRVVRAPHRPGGGGKLGVHEGTRTQRPRSTYRKGYRTEPAECTDRMEWRTGRRGKGRPERDAPQLAPRGARGKGGGQRGDARAGTGPDPPDLPRAQGAHHQGTAPAMAVVAHSATHEPRG